MLRYYQNGLKEGEGKFVWKDNSSYEGMFHNGNIEGKGKMIFPDNKTYVG